MCRYCQLFVTFLIFAFHFNYVLGNQINLERIDPCDLMMHGRDAYPDRYPEVSDFPLSRTDIPVEFHLNHSIPEQHRDIIREAAKEWKVEPEPGSEISLVTISDEIDDSHWDTAKQNPRNVIYWLTEDQYNVDDITSKNGTLRSRGKTLFQVREPLPIPYVFIINTHIVIYAESSNFMNLVEWMLTSHLENIGIEPPEDMDAIGLQRLFVERLSEMSSDDFYNMMIKSIERKEIALPSDKPEDIQRWILEETNKKMKDAQTLESLEDLRNLAIEKYSLDITSTSKDSPIILSKSILHEFGHALGVGHNDDPNSLMYDGHNRSPAPYFPKDYVVPGHVDNLALHGLLCSPFSQLF